VDQPNPKYGGFFELEIRGGSSVFHDDAIKLTTGRACVNYILKVKKPVKIYLPFYCCDALIEPVELNDIPYEFYTINEDLEIIDLPRLKSDELILYCNFFGVKSKYLPVLTNHYGSKLVLDNSHSFFTKRHEAGICSFNSARKFFGVPDGAFLYIPENIGPVINFDRNQKVSINHNLHSLLGLQEIAYSEYVEYEKSLDAEIEGISIVSERLLSMVNYSEVRRIRNINFKYFQDQLSDLNALDLGNNLTDCFCYPLLLEKSIDKSKLYESNIYVPSLWLDTLGRPNKTDFKLECHLSLNLLPLPIDHRYMIEDLRRVCNTLKEMIGE